MIKGTLTVFCGPMFAGKTEGLIERVLLAKKAVRVYKPTIDTRHKSSEIISHGGRKILGSWVSPTLDKVWPGGFIAIDEAQFLEPAAVEVICRLLECETDIVLSGLDLDYLGQPFGPMPDFIALANEVIRLEATCTQCGQKASRTHRKVENDRRQVLIGGENLYEPRCVPCWQGG
jgi:thymidine kinase